MQVELVEGTILEWPGTVTEAIELLRDRIPSGLSVTPTLSYAMGGITEKAPVFTVGPKFDRNTHAGLLDAAAWPIRLIRSQPESE